MKEYKIGREGFIILCTDGGQIIYHPNESYIQKNVSELDWPEQVKNAFLSDFTGSLDYEMDGKSYSGSMNQVGSGGWYVLSGLPVSEIEEAYQSTIRSIVVMFAGALALLIVIIFLISKGISKPLKQLAKIADQIAGGDLNIDMNVKSSDETGLVATALDRTVHKLKD